MKNRYRQTGVSLIELMVGLAVGLIVVAAAIALIVSLMRSNSDSIRSVRLSQELRALSDIAAMEIRRSRSLLDPLANVGAGAAAFAGCDDMISSGGNSCVVFAYGCDVASEEGQFRSLRHEGDNIIFAQGSIAADATCDSDGQQLNSDVLVVEDADFAVDPSIGSVELTITGHLAGRSDVSRTLTRVVWPRSSRVKPAPAP